MIDSTPMSPSDPLFDRVTEPGDLVTANVQDKQLQDKLLGLESRLQALKGDDKEATEEELASCKQLIARLHNVSSQSRSASPPQPSRSSSAPAAPVNGTGPSLPAVQSLAQSHDSQPAAPLMLGPPG